MAASVEIKVVEKKWKNSVMGCNCYSSNYVEITSGFQSLMANTSCPIELEPRTLNQLQLTQAREVAAEVVQKLEPCEASALFIEGVMHPIEDENGRLAKKLVDCMKKSECIPDDKARHCE